MKRTAVVIVMLVAALGMSARAQTLEARLQKAIQAETVTGDLRAAIDEYRRIADGAGTNRRVAAQALMRMAECHRKLGNAEAAKIFERIVRDFGDQPDAADARAKLAALRSTDRAATGPMTRQIWSGDGVDALGAPSFDGRILSYTDWNTGDLGIRDLATGQNRLLTRTGGWETSGDFAEFSIPSPDGREVVYAWFNDKHDGKAAYDLRVMATSGAAQPRILHPAGSVRWVAPGAWTPDGKSVVFVREFPDRRLELAIVTVATREIRALAPISSGAQRVSVSPDGRYVAFDQAPRSEPANRDLFVMSIGGGAPERIVDGPANDQMPLWTPDGAHLVFVSSRTGSNALWSVPMRGGRPAADPVVIRADAGTFYPLGITSSGALIYFEGGARDNVYQVTIDGARSAVTAPVMLTNRYVNANSSGAWSRDGRFLAYYAYPGSGSQPPATIIIRDTRDGRERAIPLTFTVPRAWAMLQWYPSGDAILACGRTDGASGTVYFRIDLDSGREQELFRVATRATSTCAAGISPDGRFLFHIDQEEPEAIHYLRRRTLATGATEVMWEGWVTALAMSPDGAHLAVLMTTEGQSARRRDLALLPTAGGPPRVLHTASWYDTSRFHTLGWTPDAKHLFFVRPDGDGQAMWTIPVEGGTPRQVLSVRGRIKQPQVHPDGRQMMFTMREFGANAIWTLENFLPAGGRR